MTAQQLVLDLLQYIGVYGFGPGDNDNQLNQPGMDEADVQKAVSAVNGALQEIYDDGPDTFRHAKRSAFFNTPTPITLSATRGSLTATATTTVPAWMKGCSIMVGGDGDLNEIVELRDATVTLLRAYTGSTASGLVSVVYADATVLATDVSSVSEPVLISPSIRIYPARSREQFDALAYGQNDYCGNGNSYTTGTNKQVGTPAIYLVEQLKQQLVLRLNPMAGYALNVTYQCALTPTKVDRDTDLGVDDDTDPGTEFTALPDFMVESVLLPIARYRFFAHPALKNSETRPWVQAEYSAAKTKLLTKPSRSVHATRARFI